MGVSPSGQLLCLVLSCILFDFFRCRDDSVVGKSLIPKFVRVFMLDTRSPQPSEIKMAVRWACRKREQKRPVFVHCTYGMI